MELQVKVDKRLGGFFLDMEFVCQGDRTGLFGPSGSGKSTLVGLIAGLGKPDNGSILLDGERLYDSRKGICLPPERRRIGIVFQHPHLFPHLSVEGNLLYGLKRSVPGHANIDFADLVETLQIGELLERGVNNLSGGEKQRVSIGRAVLANPRLLLMDEPLFALPSREIILFKRHPGAISARNLFKCAVTGTFPAGAWVGIELDCRREHLVAEVVRAAAEELEGAAGSELYAAIKASSFRKLN